MYAIRSKDHEGEWYFDSIENYLQTLVEYYPPGDDGKIYEIEVSPHPDQTPETKTSGFSIDYWGWLATDAKEYDFVYASYPSFFICFAGGPAAEEERGLGKAYRLKIRVVASYPDKRKQC